MALGRENIYVAFFAQLNSILLTSVGGSFAYSSRRYKPLGNAAKELYPVFYLVEDGETYDRSVLFVPAKVILHSSIIIQTVTNDPKSIPATELNNLADEVENAINSFCGPTAQNILGGLVQEAWINNRQMKIAASIQERWSEQTLMIDLVTAKVR